MKNFKVYFRSLILTIGMVAGFFTAIGALFWTMFKIIDFLYKGIGAEASFLLCLFLLGCATAFPLILLEQKQLSKLKRR